MHGPGQPEARKLRARPSHPIVDADGHWLDVPDMAAGAAADVRAGARR